MSRTAVSAMLVLSFSTGIIDAATYFGLHGVFTANMTGNLIFVSLGFAGQSQAPLFRALLALFGFMLGAAAAGLLFRAHPSPPTRDRRLYSSLGMVGGLLCAAAICLGVLPHNAAVLDALTVMIATAMGIQAMAARRVGVGDVSTVVVTSTLAGLMGENRATGATAAPGLTQRRALAVTSMGLGAVLGAFLMVASIVAALLVASALTFVVTAVLANHHQRIAVAA